jgi:UDP-N-acetylmuramoyl-L-alanyl-D-glutamate--2,6-diaminopimelate ligase
MQLGSLIAALTPERVIGTYTPDTTVARIVSDSRQVAPGDLFVAIDGVASDGHRYIPQAVARGAVAILAQREVATAAGAPLLIAADTRAALATAAAAFYGFPARRLRVIGVTGTDGKTTTTTFIQSILTASGRSAGMISTIGAKIDDAVIDIGTHVTTPGAPEIQRFLAQMVDAGIEYVVLETTSHALDQRRVLHCGFDVAVLTNITHEHLDYHGSYEAYRDAKARLFHALYEDPSRKPDVPRYSILNADDPAFALLRRIPADAVFSYALAAPADFTAVNIRHAPDGTTFELRTPHGAAEATIALPGDHNVANALAAAAAAASQGIDVATIVRGLGAVPAVPARMQRVECGQDFDIFVDYAHTPAALEQVLRTARSLTRGRVVLVFGLSGGPRDPSKRAAMGRIAGALADRIVITAVDWYEQDVGEIMAAIAEGCEQAGRREGIDYWCERERAEGIARGVALANPGDTLIVAGKGHELSIASAGVDRPWDEFAAVRAAVARRFTPPEEP